MKLSVQVSKTSQTINVFIGDSSSATGAGLTGLVFNSSGLTAYYCFSAAAPVAITLATLAANNSSYSSGGFKEIDSTNMPGWYRFDIPNAALASGNGRFVSFHFKGATNMVPLPVEIELTAWDNQDAVRGGLTALPNANIDTAGGLSSSVIRSGTAQAGASTTITLDSGASSTNGQYVGHTCYINGGTGIGQFRVVSTYTGSSKIAGVSRPWQTTPDNTSTFVIIGGDTPATVSTSTSGAGVILSSYQSPYGISFGNGVQSATNTTVTLSAGAGSTVDHFYDGQIISINGGTGVGQFRTVTSYVGSTKVATIDRAWVTNPDSTSTYSIGMVAPAFATAGFSGIDWANINAPTTTQTLSGTTVATVTNRVTANADQWAGGTIPSPNVTGVPIVDKKYELGTTIPTPPVAGYPLDITHAGTAQAGATTSITLASGASSTDNLYNGQILSIISGTGAGQSRVIGSYTGSTKVALVTTSWGGYNWKTTPDNTSVYVIRQANSPTLAVLNNVTNAWASLQAQYCWYTLSSAVTSATSTTLVLSSSNAVSTDNTYLGQIISVYTGTGAGQTRTITGYTGSTKTVTVDRAWTTNPDSTSFCDIGLVADQHATSGYSAIDWANINAPTTTQNLSGTTVATVTNRVTANADQWAGGTIPSPNVTGVPLVDDKYLLGTVYASPATAGIMDVNVKNIAGTASAGTAGYVGIDWGHVHAPTSTVDLSGTTISNDVDVYYARISFTKDETDSQDEYTVTWFKNAVRLIAGITSPTIEVIKRSDGSDLIASTAMTQIGTTASYKYDAVTTERQTSGQAYIVVVTASIDSGTRSFAEIVSRDS